MSQDENFVSRWSRLKRKKAEQPAKEPGAGAPEDRASDPLHAKAPAAPGAGKAAPDEPQIDLSTLPSLEEITAGTDIRAFLQSGVPANLAKAALRRAWTTDPAIRDFIGIAENQWDFTDPASIPGFGPLLPGDNVPELVARAMGRLEETAEQARQEEVGVAKQDQPTAELGTPAAGEGDAGIGPQAVEAAERAEEPVDGSALAVSEQREVALRSQHVVDQDDATIRTSRRGHGRALPQ